MKKFLSVILTICLVIAMVPMGAFSITASAETATSGTTGDCTWTLDGTVLTISGNGKMYNYAYLDKSPWRTDITEVIIKDGVTSIGSSAFDGCSSLTSVTIPDSVTSIGGSAFYGCSSLTSVKIPNGVTIIESYTFHGCSSFTSITIPDSVTSIGYSAFYGCSNLTSITIPDSITSIGRYAFEGCSSLASTTIPNSVKSIGNGAFWDCSSLKDVYITDIGAWCNIAFYNDLSNPLYYASNLYLNGELVKDMVIPDGATKIPAYAFSCNSLESITIPEGVKSIGDYAFNGCSSLTDITIPDSVKSIGSSAFYGCSSLTSVKIPDGVTSIDRSAFSGCSSLTNITIPNSVTSIGDYAFYDCSSLANITMSNSVTSIGTGSFSGCESLTSITIPDSVTSIGSAAFDNTGYYNNEDNWQDDVLYIGNYIGNHLINCKTSKTGEYKVKDGTKTIAGSAFYNCSSLANITIPDSVTSIGDQAFRNCDSLTSVKIPGGVTSIGWYAFYDCSSLTSITIPKDVTNIGVAAFYNTGYYNNADNWQDDVLYISNHLIKCKETKNGEYKIKDGTKTIAGDSFIGCSSLTSIEIPDSVTSIGYGAFLNCSSLTNIKIPDSVTSIGDYAFTPCENLKDVWYTGSKSEKAEIFIEERNYSLIHATWHYNTCTGEHTYSGACDTTCNLCEWIRDVETEHSYDNSCDNKCNVCGYVDETRGHVYSGGDDDAFCDNCGYIRAIKNFPDVAAGAWFYEPVNYVVGKGMMKGYGGTDMFGAANNLQREEFILMLARYAGVDLDKYEAQESKFSDVPEGAWFEGAINWGAEKGIITGYGNTGVFGVGDTITREQLVLMLCRYAEKVAGKDVSVGADAATNAANRFVDFGNVSDWATDAVLWAVENGVITGAGAQKNLINPQGNAQRCEIAQIMYNIFKNDVL